MTKLTQPQSVGRSDSDGGRYVLQDVPSADPFTPNLPLLAGFDQEKEVQTELGM